MSKKRIITSVLVALAVAIAVNNLPILHQVTGGKAT